MSGRRDRDQDSRGQRHPQRVPTGEASGYSNTTQQSYTPSNQHQTSGADRAYTQSPRTPRPSGGRPQQNSYVNSPFSPSYGGAPSSRPHDEGMGRSARYRRREFDDEYENEEEGTDDDETISDEAEWSNSDSGYEDPSTGRRSRGKQPVRPSWQGSHRQRSGYPAEDGRSADDCSAQSSQPRPRESSGRDADLEYWTWILHIDPATDNSSMIRAQNSSTQFTERHTGIQAVISSTRFRDWVWRANPTPLIIRAGVEDEYEAGEFSAMSVYAAMLSKWMQIFNGVVSITFICGSYRAERHRSDGVLVALLRSFCFQPLSVPGIVFDSSHRVFNREDIRAMKDGDLDELENLFVRLVAALSKVRSALVCIIDGVHVIEEAEDGFSEFAEIFESFEALRATSARKHFNLKVLLTLPQYSEAEWNEMGLTSLHVPETTAGLQKPELGPSRSVTFECLDVLLRR